MCVCADSLYKQQANCVTKCVITVTFALWNPLESPLVKNVKHHFVFEFVKEILDGWSLGRFQGESSLSHGSRRFRYLFTRGKLSPLNW